MDFRLWLYSHIVNSYIYHYVLKYYIYTYYIIKYIYIYTHKLIHYIYNYDIHKSNCLKKISNMSIYVQELTGSLKYYNRIKKHTVLNTYFGPTC